MTQVLNGMQVDHGTIPNSRVLNDSKSYIEMTLDEYLHTQNRKDEQKAINAKKTLSNYHKNKGHVHSV